jgi:membrane protein
VRETAYGWSKGNTFQLGAALAFYRTFALAPTLVIAIALAGILFGKDAAKGRLDAQLADAVGPSVAQAVAEILTSVHANRSGWTATLVGFSLVLFGATGMFIQPLTALNAIWGVQLKPGCGVWNIIRSRFFAFLLVLTIVALLVLSLIANAALVALRGDLPPAYWSGESFLWEGADWLLSLALLTLLVAMIYKLLPDAVIAWRNVWVGSFITALLFVLGNYLNCQHLYRPPPLPFTGQPAPWWS